MDYEKTLNRKRHKELMEMLEQLEIKGKCIKLMRNLYWDPKTWHSWQIYKRHCRLFQIAWVRKVAG